MSKINIQQVRKAIKTLVDYTQQTGLIGGELGNGYFIAYDSAILHPEIVEETSTLALCDDIVFIMAAEYLSQKKREGR